MGNAALILAVDIGTSATKVVLFDEDARQIAVVRRHYPILTPRSGWSEQDPDAIAQAVLDGMAQALRSLPAGAHLLGVVFSSQLYSVLAAGSDGRPLSRSLTWSDTRSAEQAATIRQSAAAPAIYARTGCPIDAIYPLAKIAWLRACGDLPAGARFASIKEYVIYRLTGAWIVDWSVASATGLFDIHTRRWDDEALAAAGIDAASLSELASPRHILREWRPEVAAALGLRADTPLILGGGDGPLASIGVGSLQTNALAINVGTSAAARMLIPEPFVDPNGRLWTYVADENLWVIGGIVSTGGLVYEWALRTFLGGHYDAEANGVAARALAERLAASVPPGADNLLFVPYLGGEQCPAWNPSTRGSFFGLDFRHKHGHFMRSVLEGITRSIYRIGESIEAARGEQPHEIRTTGGVSTSPLWLQIAADMFGIPIVVPVSAEGSARGAAVLGLLALGRHRAIADFHLLAAAQQSILPDPQAHDFYARQYGQFKHVIDFARSLAPVAP
jgi:gluconokinase